MAQFQQRKSGTKSANSKAGSIADQSTNRSIEDLYGTDYSTYSAQNERYRRSAGRSAASSSEPVERSYPAQYAEPGGYVPASYGVANQYSRNSGNYRASSGRGSQAKRGISVVLVLALIVAVAGLGFYVYKETQKNTVNSDLHSLSEDEMSALDAALTGSVTFDAPFTVLLLGTDTRSDDPSMGSRTDTNILVRVDPTTNTISMMSIPRDTMVDLPGVGTAKFNAAYYYGGPSGAVEAATRLTGVQIDHYAEIDFEGLVDLIDAIGGIDVYVEERIDDPDAGPFVIEEGWQHLNGGLALEFSRSRAYIDGDYTRQRNQRTVIDAIIHKVLEAPATDLAGIIQTSTSFVTTDSGIDFDFIYSLADQIRHNNDYPLTVYSANIPSYTADVEGVAYVIADEAGVAEMVRVFNEGGDISQVA